MCLMACYGSLLWATAADPLVLDSDSSPLRLIQGLPWSQLQLSHGHGHTCSFLLCKHWQAGWLAGWW